MSNKAISNSNPEVHIQNGAGSHPEPVLVGSANQMIRGIFLGLGLVILVLTYFCIESQKSTLAMSREIGVLQEKVSLLEDIVINKAFSIKEAQ